MPKITKEQLIQKLKNKNLHYIWMILGLLIYIAYQLGYVSEEAFNSFLQFIMLMF